MDVIKSEVYSWAAETSQEHVAIEICKAWFLSGERSECIKLYPMDDGCGRADWQAINNNRQKLFRWFDGQSARAVARTRLLRNAILTALPTERRARVSGDKTTYLLIILTKEVSRIITAALMQERDMSQQIKSLRKVLDSLESSISGVDKTRARASTKRAETRQLP
ncbi:TPA: tRNA-(guanine-N1)-methyltransferase [Klebsiella oxytoca]|nr:tRNA-(guanine-N1)-methyltransferase [Klebsiella pneumoniae]HDX8965671.1 tRNA-(guanine-N1)-methyltransferase [Klebsiella oxytoca]